MPRSRAFGGAHAGMPSHLMGDRTERRGDHERLGQHGLRLGGECRAARSSVENVPAHYCIRIRQGLGQRAHVASSGSSASARSNKHAGRLEVVCALVPPPYQAHSPESFRSMAVGVGRCAPRAELRSR